LKKTIELLNFDLASNADREVFLDATCMDAQYSAETETAVMRTLGNASFQCRQGFAVSLVT